MTARINVFVVAISLVVVISSLFIVSVEKPVFCTYKMGVSKGDSFVYDYAASWNPSNPQDQVYEHMSPITRLVDLRIESVRITVDSVDEYSDSVHYTRTEYFKDGTEDYSREFANPWENYGTHGSNFYFFPPDVSVSGRETNHVTLDMTNADGDSEHIEQYFDKKTGVLVEYLGETHLTGPVGVVSEHLKLEESSIWTVPSAVQNPEYPLYIWIIGVVISLGMTCGIALAVRRKRKAREINRPPART